MQSINCDPNKKIINIIGFTREKREGGGVAYKNRSRSIISISLGVILLTLAVTMATSPPIVNAESSDVPQMTEINGEAVQDTHTFYTTTDSFTLSGKTDRSNYPTIALSHNSKIFLNEDGSHNWNAELPPGAPAIIWVVRDDAYPNGHDVPVTTGKTWSYEITNLQPGINKFNVGVKDEGWSATINIHYLVPPTITVYGADGTTPINSDDTINVTTNIFTLSGTVSPAGELVIRDSAKNYLGHILLAGNTETADWSYTFGNLQSGMHTFYLESRAATDRTVRSDPFTININSSATATPDATAPAITVTAPDGTVTADGVVISTTSTDLTISGTVSPAGELVIRDSAKNYLGHILLAGNTETADWSYTFGNLQSGMHTFYLESRAATDRTVRSDPFTININSSATATPDATAPAITVTAPDGTVTADGVVISTTSTDLTISGTVSPAGELVIRDSAKNYLGHILLAGNTETADWSYTFGNLQSGMHTFYLESRAATDRTVRSDPFTININSSATATPDATAPAITVTAPDGTVTADGVVISTTSTDLTISGTVSPAGELVIRDSAKNYLGHILLAGNTETADWSYTFGNLQSGMHTFYLESRAATDRTVRSDHFEVEITLTAP